MMTVTLMEGRCHLEVHLASHPQSPLRGLLAPIHKGLCKGPDTGGLGPILGLYTALWP